MPIAPGTQLGPYEISVPLGAGGMGTGNGITWYRAHPSREKEYIVTTAEFDQVKARLRNIMLSKKAQDKFRAWAEKTIVHNNPRNETGRIH